MAAMIKKLLVANRGEIASRIFRTCRKMGIATVAVYSDADAGLGYVDEADEAVRLGGAVAADSYLNIEKILAAVRSSGADAVHPGFGFLSENADFAEACATVGAIFVGPHPEAIRRMGSKDAARILAQSLGVPVVPGYDGGRVEEFAAHAQTIGYPVLLKAAAGGGGKGMKIVSRPEDLAAAVVSAQAEARSAFGNDTLIVEKYLVGARHVEVQIVGDATGEIFCFFERDCSVQRRYQKIVEEAPAPHLCPLMREKLFDSALTLARALRYDNAGTVEFVTDGRHYHYFLEVNTRLQVEHPVTEEITGVDLVELQIRAAEGKKLSPYADKVDSRGHAVECRIYAEDPDNDFLPAAGKIRRFFVPEGVRLETGVASGTEIGAFYDPMLAKVVARGRDRDEALQKMIHALERTVIFGVKTNVEYLLRVLKHPVFAAGEHDTTFVGRHAHELKPTDQAQEILSRAALAYRFARRLADKHPALAHLPAGWRNNPFAPQKESFRHANTTLELEYYPHDDHRLEFADGAVAVLTAYDDESITLECNGRRQRYQVLEAEGRIFVHAPGLGTAEFEILPRYDDPESALAADGDYRAPVPGQISRVLVAPGQNVQAGDALVVILSMKMEHGVCAPNAAVVKEVFVQEGQFVEAGAVLLEVE
jgi:acetyl/propionyl-CoA carboxylase alpha subunit